MEGTMATIMLFAGNFAPRYWAYCNGQILSIAQNQALFALLGTTFGGNGTTTFALPDLQGRAAIGSGSGIGRSSFVLGQKAGTPTVTLTNANLPYHSHPISGGLTATTAAPNTDEGPGSILAGATIYGPGGDGQLAGVSADPTGIAGNSAPVNIMQPYLGLNFVICVQGIFPSRS
ncbi:MAG: tail fiber protein [Saprospiraceae bacterium]|nr:tail fiber protein [Saprospiraceae bacterium]